MTFGAVINEASGSLTGRAAADREELRRQLGRFIEASSIKWVKGPEVGREADRLARQGIDVLVAGGGDGTISAAGAVAAQHRCGLAILPLGTLNHLARDLGIPLELTEAIEIARRMRSRRIDIGQVNGSTFLNNVSIGIYPALVTERRKYMDRHGWRKAPAYLAAAWQVLRRISAPPIALELEHGRIVRGRPIVLFVGNNAYNGKVWSNPKRPMLDGGKLWVYMTRSDRTWPLIEAVWKLGIGMPADAEEVETALVDSLTVRFATRSVRVAVDGETRRMRTPLELRSLPGALKVIVP